MNLKEKFIAFVDLFEDLGKETFSFIVLSSGLVLLCKGLLTGQEFSSMVQAIGVAYIGGCAVGSTSDALIKHLEARAQAKAAEVLSNLQSKL
jgi:hypothetical protein